MLDAGFGGAAAQSGKAQSEHAVPVGHAVAVVQIDHVRFGAVVQVVHCVDLGRALSLHLVEPARAERAIHALFVPLGQADEPVVLVYIHAGVVQHIAEALRLEQRVARMRVFLKELVQTGTDGGVVQPRGRIEGALVVFSFDIGSIFGPVLIQQHEANHSRSSYSSR